MNYDIQSDFDHQRVSLSSCSDTDDIELPLPSFLHDIDVEVPEEYEKYNMCKFKSYIYTSIAPIQKFAYMPIFSVWNI